MALPTSPHGSVDESSVYWSNGYGVVVDALLDYIPELTWPHSIRTYSRMRWDPQLKAVLAAYTLPIRRSDWAVDPAGCRDEVVQDVANSLGLPIKGDADPKPTGARRRGVQWSEHLRLALLDLVFGHMAFSRWYDLSGPKARIAGISERMPQTIDEIKLAGDGSIDFIEQGLSIASPGQANTKIRANELVWYAHEREGSNWTGQSLLRSSYSAWLIKHEIWRVHATSIRRFGMGIPQVNAPAGALPNQIAEAGRLAASYRSGDSSGMGLPNGFTMALVGMTGSVPDAVAFINYLDKQMTRATLTSLLDMTDSTHGSRALGETFMDLFLLSLQTIADEHAQQATSQLSVPLVDANWGEDEPAPNITCGDVGSEHEVTAQTIQLLLSCGAIEPDPSIDAYLRGQYKLPERTIPWTSPNAVANPDGPPPGAENPAPVDPVAAASAVPIAAAAATHVYEWKHGWIPLTHAAAMAKAKGNHKLAEKYVPAAKRRKTAQHITDYHAARQAQDRRFESIHGGAGISVQDTHRQEYRDYFGVGDHRAGVKVEDRITFKQHLANMAESKADEREHAHSYNTGVELGKRHQAAGLSTEHENAEYDRESRKVAHEDDFSQGYGDGLSAAYEKAAQDRNRLEASQVKELRGGSAEAHLVTDSTGTHFSPERQALHDKIIHDIVTGHQAQEHPAFVMLGGGPASGKTKAATAAAQEFPDAIKIDPDEIKQALPEYHAQPDRTKAAAHVHEESSYLAKRAQAEGLKSKAHIVLDAVGDSSVNSVKGKVDAARAAGYSAHARYVTVPTEVAQVRAHERGLKSGRVVAPEVVSQLHSGVSKVFPAVIDHFDTASLHDNSGTEFTKVLSKAHGGTRIIHDEAAYQRFTAKA